MFLRPHPRAFTTPLSRSDESYRTRTGCRSQSVKWMDRKVQEYLNAGTRLVWVIDSERQRALVYRSGSEVTFLDKGDTLDGEDVVPGFRLAIAILFD